MILRLLALTAATALAATALTGCVRIGPMTSESPEIDDVTAVVLDTSGDLTITEGDPALTIHAPEGVVDRLTATVRDGVLELGRRPGIPFGFGRGEIRYDLTLRHLDAIEVNGSGDIASTVSGGDITIEINGSGDVTVSGLDAEAIEVRISGSGEVELEGRADDLAVEIDGSGDADTDALEVRDARVVIGGSGDARLHVTRTLQVDISGSGSVRHRGGADVDADVSGSGDVEAD